jgi:adenylate cyclase
MKVKCQYYYAQISKNITRPVRVYRALMDNGVINEKPKKPKTQGTRQRITVFGLIGALVIISGISLWQYAQRPTVPTPQFVEKADPQKMAFPLPDKPSIAVLPFKNISEDSTVRLRFLEYRTSRC